MDIVKSFAFEAAHRLPNVPEGHKCGRMHGHGYHFDVRIEGVVDPETGWVVDFADVAAWVQRRVLDVVDHRCLNEIAGLENPTVEHLARWIWRRLDDSIGVLRRGACHDESEQRGDLRLVDLMIRETDGSAVIYRGA